MQNLAAATATAAGPPNNQPPLSPTLHNTTFFPSPGSYSSPDRFARLGILKMQSNVVGWP